MLLGLLGLLAPARAGEDLEISAARISLSEEAVEAEGAVEARLQGQTLTAARARLDRGGETLAVEDGAWPALGLRFERAELSLDGAAGTLEGARLDRPGLHLETRALTLEGGQFRFEGGDFTACDCASPLWSLEAASGRVDPLGWATVRGAWLRVGQRRVLPVPWAAVPVARVVQPLPPRIGWTDDGLTVGVPVWIPLGASALSLGPEWRQLRGLRAMGELGLRQETGGGALAGAVGWDTQERALRGSASGSAGWTPGAWRLAGSGLWTSDEAYLSDYGDSVLSRSVPWREQRLLVGVGPARLERFSWQDEEEADARTGLVVQRPVQALGPVRFGGVGRLEGADGVARVEGGLTVDHSGDLGPVEVNSALLGRAIGYGGETPSSAADGAAGLTVLLPMWAEVGGVRHELAFGGAGSAAGRAGGVLVRLPGDEALTPWSAGPRAESRWWGRRAYAVVTLDNPWTPAGPGWSGRARVGAGPWSLSAQSAGDGTGSFSGGRAGFDDEVWSAWVGTWLATGESEITQGRAGLGVWIPGPGGRWRPEVEALATPEALQEGRAGLRWAAACGCLDVGGYAAFAADREWPQASVELRLLP